MAAGALLRICSSAVAAIAVLLVPAVAFAEADGAVLVGRFLQSEGADQWATMREIPVVACRTTGQVEKDAPHLPPTTNVPLFGNGWDRLAYYSGAEQGSSGVLAPRGWMCIHAVGSSGETLVVAPPEAMATPQLASKTWAGPAVIRSIALGDTSGRLVVARLSARLFPKARDFVDTVRAEGEKNSGDYVFRPWASDRLYYLSDTVVKYETSGPEGLGYFSGMTEGSLPIRGVAGLLGDLENPSALHLAVRLGDQDAALYPTIAAQVLGSADFAEASRESRRPPRVAAVGPMAPAGPPASPRAETREASLAPPPARPVAPAGPRRSPVATVSGFYTALGRGDGFGAQQFLVPEKRGHGNYEPIAMSRFYGDLPESLSLLSANQNGTDQVRVQYRFRSRGGVCNGTATVALRREESDYLIQSIDADKGC